MVITITSDKGGVGKTTTTIHLAAVLSESRPTLVIDADKTRAALNWATRASQSGTPFPFEVIPEKRLVAYGGRYPTATSHLIIDTEGRPDDEDLEDAVRTSDLIIVPTEADTASMATLGGLLKRIDGYVGAASSKRVGVLLTNVPPLPQRDGEYAREFLKSAGLPLFETSIRSYKCYRTAWNRGTIVELIRDDPRSASAWIDCEAFAKEVLKGNLRVPGGEHNGQSEEKHIQQSHSPVH